MRIQGIRVDDQVLTLYQKDDGLEILFRSRRKNRCLSALEFREKAGRWQKKGINPPD